MAGRQQAAHAIPRSALLGGGRWARETAAPRRVPRGRRCDPEGAGRTGGGGLPRCRSRRTRCRGTRRGRDGLEAGSAREAGLAWAGSESRLERAVDVARLRRDSDPARGVAAWDGPGSDSQRVGLLLAIVSSEWAWGL